MVSGQAEPGGVGQIDARGWVVGAAIGSAPSPTLARREVEVERCDCGVKVPLHPTCDVGAAGLSSALMRSGPAHSPEAQRIPG